MLSQEQAVEIKVLARRGMGVREIARQTGISRNTVRRYLWANVVVPEWWAGRLSNVKRRRRLQDGCSHLGLRRRFAYAARSASKGVPLEERGAVGRPEVRCVPELPAKHLCELLGVGRNEARLGTL